MIDDELVLLKIALQNRNKRKRLRTVVKYLIIL